MDLKDRVFLGGGVLGCSTLSFEGIHTAQHEPFDLAGRSNPLIAFFVISVENFS